MRPSPAVVIASFALLVSLTGTGVAAVSQLAKNSVGTPQLKNNAVTSQESEERLAAQGRLQARAASARPARGRLRGRRVPAGPTGPAGPAGPPGPPGRGTTLAFTTRFSPVGSTSSATTFEAVPDASATLIVPGGETATFLMGFSSESAATATRRTPPWVGAASGSLVDGAEAAPALGSEYAFDSSDNAAELESSWESHAMQRAAFNLAAGTHTVTVERAVTHPEISFWLFGWTLTVQALKP